MDVMRLNPLTYLPDELVEGYASLVWTERQLDPSEFEMKTSKVVQTKSLIPEGSLITHLDTAEVMLVENHSIAKDSNGFPELTVSGRSITSSPEQRSLIAPVFGSEWAAPHPYTTSEIVSLLLWTHLANGSGEDPTKTDALLAARYQIQNLVITDSTSVSETAKTWYLEAGVLDQKVKDYLGTVTNLGLRAVRPLRQNANVVTVDTTRTASRGSIQKTFTSDVSAIRLDIYNGVDRSRLQTENAPVVLRYDAGHIEDPSYLFSIKDYKNLAVVNSSVGVFDVWPNGTPPIPEPEGLDLRALYIDGGSKDDAQLEADFIEKITQDALIELSKHNRSILFDAGVSILSPYKYNRDYYLGDKVTLFGEYGIEETMRVVEYVRTEDQTGDRGYPTLVLSS